jgi:hypothetical protein
MTVLIACLGTVGTFALLLSLRTLIHGYVVATLWAWFMVPLFHLQPLSLAASIGVMLPVSFVTSHGYADIPTEKLGIQLLVAFIIRPLVTLLLGWIVHFYL